MGVRRIHAGTNSNVRPLGGILRAALRLTLPISLAPLLPCHAQVKSAYSSWQSTSQPEVQVRWRSVNYGKSVPTDCELQFQYAGPQRDRFAVRPGKRPVEALSKRWASRYCFFFFLVMFVAAMSRQVCDSSFSAVVIRSAVPLKATGNGIRTLV